MKRIIQNTILLVLAGLLVWGIYWARGKAADETCRLVTVIIDNADSTQFVTPKGVTQELAKLGFKVVGKPMWQIDADRIEQALQRSEYLEKAECVKGTDGVLIIRASQLVPVLRVFDGDQSYYVNRYGKRMSATASYHADVPIVQGHFTDKYPATRLLPLVQYVEDDSLLHSLVTMYTMRDSNNIFIVPSIYGHVVNIGDCDNFEAKFRKLKLFYRKVLPAKGWENYDTISVKWDHQVVATRRVKAVKVEMDYDSAYDEPEPDLQTITVDEDRHTLAIDEKKQKQGAKNEKKDTTSKKQQ